MLVRLLRLLRFMPAGLLLLTPILGYAHVDLPASNRVEINLGQTPWQYLKDRDEAGFSLPDFDDTAWQQVGIPQSPSDNDTFINIESGGGEGQLTGNITLYRKHFTLDSAYADRKIFVEFEGSQTGAQVFINGTFIPGNSLINPNATHVLGFIPFIVDITDYVDFGGADNVLAVKVARGAAFFESPNFGGAFRFGQSDSGLFRPVWMFITDRMHIPENVYSVLETWGTYVTTLSASSSSASIRVQTNVLNEYDTDQPVTLTTQIVDVDGNVLATGQDSQVVAANQGPGLHPALFDQMLTVSNPTLWYPNNSIYGGPYLYHVIHIVSMGGTVVDVAQTPLGIRTITWDNNFPIINGHPHYLWGASGRYDYPALGSAVPEEQWWRDLSLLARAGGSLYRPGHCSQGPEFLDAADAYGIMVVQPSGDGENGFATGNPTAADVQLKMELHRDMIVHDRNHPSVLAWEADNGATDTTIAQQLKAISEQWDPIHTRAQSDRTPNPANGDILSCSGQGCDIGVKNAYPDKPAWGAEYWGDGVGRAKYDYELEFAASYVNDWVHSVAGKSFGIAHWYLADTPGEINTQTDGTPNYLVRGNGASMMDFNRIPRLLYYIYEAAWTPFEIKPVVKLAHHWNRSGQVRVNAFSNCPAVRLLLNGQVVGADQIPNPKTSDPKDDLSQQTTLLPGQVHWDDVTWQPGTLTAACLDDNGSVVATDELATAGPADHIQLDVTPELIKPNGDAFEVKANGTDATFITATVVDADGNRVPEAENLITFSVSGPGTYRGGADHYVTEGQPEAYHAPGDPELSAEGGMTRIAVRAQFTPGTVTVSATSPGLGSGTTTFEVVPTGDPQQAFGGVLDIGPQPPGTLQIVTQPLDQTVTQGRSAVFTVLTAGSGPLSFQWMKNGTPIAGADSYTYTTPATTLNDDGAQYTVTVSDTDSAVASLPAWLTVVAPAAPSIVTPPADQNVISGQSAAFSVVANGSPVLTYQWLRDGVAIAGATQAVYNTPVVHTEDNGALFSVVVTNSAGTITSPAAVLSVDAATLPTIITQPKSQSVPVGQSVTLTVQATGSAPLHYQWYRNGSPVGKDEASYVIPSAQSGDAGSYTVTVSNAAGSVTSTPTNLLVSGGSGTNLALAAVATASSMQNGGLAPSAAVDGDFSSRWSSAPEIDPSWITLDFGNAETFDQVVIVWENAYAKAYQIQVSDDNQNWTTVYTNSNGTGGTESATFATTTARYIRMYGTARATQYGYSLWEFEVFNVPQCGAGERYTNLGAVSGSYESTIPGIPSGPNVPLVRDNVSGLVWQQYVTTFSDQGAQFTQPIAAQYCASVGMRLPTQDEALSIAGANYASCAFPSPWGTWTTTGVPNEPNEAYMTYSTGQSVPGIIDNTPGWALCVQGDAVTPPAITVQPQSQTATAGQTATFTLTATGPEPLSFIWLKNGNQVAVTTEPSYTTPATTNDDNGAVFLVMVSNPGGSVTSDSVTLTVNPADTGGGTGDTGGTGGTGGGTGDTGGAGNTSGTNGTGGQNSSGGCFIGTLQAEQRSTTTINSAWMR